MRKVLVFQHVAHKILGTLNPLMKQERLRVRYINFEREPEASPTLDKYSGLVILGGHMGVYEAHKYTHIKVEMRLIEEALKKEIPILGICLGSQILAHVLGSEVYQAPEKEIGWYDIELTSEGRQDPLFADFQQTEKIFQLHGDTFEIPKSCQHLATANGCTSQAFRYGDKAYGLQFHLEVDEPMILRWLDNPINQKEISRSNGKFSIEQIRAETSDRIGRSMELSRKTFMHFISLFGQKERRVLLGSKD
ncbi:MAG: type 1 glutamine amidotransferase [Bacteriovoracaceae bacterium]|nr:type 1 glutamine amidotransferase [Bacteriovoracaceae bacterium]